MDASEVLVDILQFLDRFSIDAVEFSSRRLRNFVASNMRHLTLREVQIASVCYIESSKGWGVVLEAIIPGKEPDADVVYGETKHILSSMNNSFASQCQALECMFRALHSSRVHNMQVDDYVISKAASDIIHRYASTVRVNFLCFRRVDFAWGCDMALICSSFERLAELRNVKCVSCPNGFTDGFRNFCVAKNIHFE